VQGAAWLKVEGRGQSCGHATRAGITAVRRSRLGHREVARTHGEGDKPGKFFWQVSTECGAMSVILPDSTVSGGFWEEPPAYSLQEQI
jgi:hypothetical protein